MLWDLSPVYCTVTSAQKYMKPSLIQGRAHRKEILPQAHHFHRHHVGTLLVGVGPRVDAGERKYADGFLPEKATTKRVWTKDPAGPRSRHRQLCLDEPQNKRKISVSVDVTCIYPATLILVDPTRFWGTGRVHTPAKRKGWATGVPRRKPNGLRPRYRRKRGRGLLDSQRRKHGTNHVHFALWVPLPRTHSTVP